MVTIIDFRKEHSDSGKEYVRLIVQSDELKIVTTEEGRAYVSAPKASVISTISEALAKSQIGRKLPGTIERVKTKPWTYTDSETGEQRVYDHRYLYCPDCKEELREEVFNV